MFLKSRLSLFNSMLDNVTEEVIKHANMIKYFIDDSVYFRESLH